MPKTRINCPNCRQPIMADIDQLFDVGQDPTAKQKILSGAFNLASCPNCGYKGMIATPLVYHDPDKNLLLTYFPPELSMPVNEQERIIGPLITRITNSLPQEKRKAYLFQPQAMLTLQTMVERILAADGITKEMIQAQQDRMNLLQQLMNASDEMISESTTKEDKLFDSEFFTLLNRLIEAAAVNGDQEASRRLSDLQKKLLEKTTFGKQVQEQSKDVEAAIQTLQSAGKSLTREKLLEMVIKAPNETQLSVLASLGRPGMDYEFFQLLSEKIDRARADGRDRLIKLRDQLLDMTRAIDKQMEERLLKARKNLNSIVQSKDIKTTMAQNLAVVDEFFVQVFNDEMEAARKAADLEKIEKLKQVEEVVDKASTPPPEVALIQELLEAAASDDELTKKLDAHKSEITSEFMDILSSLLVRSESGEDAELKARMNKVFSSALRITMSANLSQNN
ncbi:MAG TPA: CpXC domain-containing protein [Anaerolineales bacterium]|nr:CpXC domain-containing protein [Anaerolineales bacterium]